MMTATACPQCHAELPTDAPQGLCPKCLLRRVMDTESDADIVDGELGMAVTNMPAVKRSEPKIALAQKVPARNWTLIASAIVIIALISAAALFFSKR